MGLDWIVGINYIYLLDKECVLWFCWLYLKEEIMELVDVLNGLMEGVKMIKGEERFWS